MQHAKVAGHWLLIAVVFVGVLEVCARIDDAIRWQAPFIGSYTHSMLWVRDSLGFRNRPGVQYEKWRLNSHGFRGPEVAVERTAGVVRIGILGASETFGLFESEGHEYPAQLRARLDAAAPGRYEVINFAVAGMGLPTMRSYYETIVAPFAPDILVLYPSPSFYLDTAAPEPVPPLDGPADYTATPLPRIASKAETMLKRFVPKSVQERLKTRSIRRVRGVHGASWVWEDVPAERMQLFRRDLAQLIEAAGYGGTRIVLLTHTNRFAGGTPLTPEDRFHLHNILSLFPRASERAVISVDDSANAIIRDLAVDFDTDLLDIAERLPGTAANFADYSHFTDEGAGLMADLIAEHVAQVGRHSLNR